MSHHVNLWCTASLLPADEGTILFSQIRTLLNLSSCLVRVAAHASSGSDFSDAEEEDEAEEGSDVSQELDPHGCDSTGAVSEDWADSDSEQHITTDSNGKADGWAGWSGCNCHCERNATV